MEFSELIQNRYSVRSYKPEPIEDEKLHRILEAARIAPSAANRQPLKIIVINTNGREEELGRIYVRSFFTTAPVIICVCGIESEGWIRKKDNKSYMYVDAAIVMDHMILEATNQGLGTCWIAAFDPDEAKTVLGLPENVTPILFTTLGYPGDQPKTKERKSLAEIVMFERWQKDESIS